MFDTFAPLLAETPWAITRAVLDGFVNTRLESIVQPQAAAGRTPSRSGRGLAVIPIRGTISQHAGGGLFDMLFGGTTTDQLAAEFRDALADESVRGIVLDIDSPGGSALGISEFSSEIYRARGKKPIVAVANSVAASAAYWLGTSADEFYTTPGGITGSVGVYAVHMDLSAAAEKEGIKPTIFSAGKYKTEGNEFEALTDEGRKAAQQRVESYYDLFVHDVARNRGATESAVRNGYGEGRALAAKDAVAAGLVDGIRTYEQVLQRIGTEPRSMASEAAFTHLSLLEHLESAASADLELATRLKRRSDFRAGEGRALGDPTVTAVQSWMTARTALTHEVEQMLAEQPNSPAATARQDRFRAESWRLHRERIESDLERLKVSA